MSLPLIAALFVVLALLATVLLFIGIRLLRRFPLAVRLLPAAVPVVLAVLLIGWLLFPLLPFSNRGGVVPCRDLITLRDLAGHLQTVTNPRTGQTMEYVVVGDGAKSNQLLVFFNGTSQILADWPVQMLTNRTASPLIRATASYSGAEDGPLSLCHDYRLVLFDYPGIGLSPEAPSMTFDQISNDVDAMLGDIGQKDRLQTNDISVAGWSLGTVVALKYAFLSPIANPARKIHDVVLIATKPGGGQSDQTDGHGAQCVDSTFDLLKTPSISSELRTKLDANNFRLIFPYKGQQPYDGPDSGCSINIDPATESASLSVSPPDCGLGTECLRAGADWLLNRFASPWSKTEGVPQRVLLNQRNQTHDFNFSYCPTAGPDFTSLGCTSLPSQPPVLSATNGGVCKTSTPPGSPNEPMTAGCVPLRISGAVTVINGFEDLYIQHTYGAALVKGYQQQYGSPAARLVTYPGSDGAGHGVLVQHPRWTQEQIFAALGTGG